MPTIKKRLNITLEPDVQIAIERIAKKERVPEATKAAELIRIALDLQEDYVLMALAEERDSSRARFISHDSFWKKALKKK